MVDHETPEEMDGGLEELLGSKEAVRHLLKGCGVCRTAARKGRVSRAAARGESLDTKLSAAYDVSLDHAEEFARRVAPLAPREQERFRKALGLLRSGKGVLALTDGGMMVEGEGVYEALLLRSWMIRYDDPQHMCHLAKVAVEMSDRFDPEVHGAEKVADLQARAWGELANAYRVADRLREAEQAFGTAFTFLRQGSGDRRLLMRLLELEASLLGTLRDFDVALQRLTILSNMYREIREDHLAGRTLVTKALYTFYRGKNEEACRIITEALVLIDRDRDPSLVLVATFDQLLFLVESGQFKDAKRVLFDNRPKFTHQGRIAMLKLRGVEGCINYGLGQLESAEIAFREAKEGFMAVEMGLAVALAGLELAMTLMRQGRVDEAIREGLESAAMFLSLSIHRELQGTVMFLQEAFETRKTDLALLETAMRYLRRKLIEFGFK